VASHGQTIHHVDRSTGRPSTLQVGEPAVIAERTGRIVVADFRTRDIAAGGGGAPLVAYVDHCLLARPGRTVLLQNIGGIANVTVVTPDPARVVAFDTGPGNVLIDEVCRELTGDDAAFDKDGGLSALGEVDQALLAELLRHDYLRLTPPKTTGRELFGADMVHAMIDAYDRDRLIDLLTTLVHFTACSIAAAYREHVLPGLTPRATEAIVSGGGVHNLTLMRVLADELARDGLAVRSFDDLGLGFSAKAKEAVAFAILANETVQGRASNLPAATGARRPVIQGKIVI
jgi:anhydro-N-acetylmuramic acid kinase